MHTFLIFLCLLFSCILVTANDCQLGFREASPRLKTSSVTRIKSFPRGANQKQAEDLFQPIRISYIRYKGNITNKDGYNFQTSLKVTEDEWQQLEGLLKWILNDFKKVRKSFIYFC